MAFLLGDSPPYLANGDRAQEQFRGLLHRHPLSNSRVSVRPTEGRYYIRVQQQCHRSSGRGSSGHLSKSKSPPLGISNKCSTKVGVSSGSRLHRRW